MIVPRHGLRLPEDFVGTRRRRFGPLDLANVAAWYRADMGITIATGVSQWNDLSSNGKHWTQAAVGAQPLFVTSGINGRPTVRFDGTDDVMGATTATARGHVFAVIKQVTEKNQPWLGQGTAADGFTCAWLTGVTWSQVTVGSSTTGLGQVGGASSNTSFHYLSMNAFAASNSGNVIFYDGTSVDTGTDGSGGYGPVNGSLGNYRSDAGGVFANVEIAELVIYSTEKSASERLLLEKYFRTRYAL